MSLTFAELRNANTDRCDNNYRYRLMDWSENDWAVALAGEVGELCNFLKKVKRGDFTFNEVRDEISNELADCQIYLDLLAARLGISLEEATASKFNEVSIKYDCPQRLYLSKEENVDNDSKNTR